MELACRNATEEPSEANLVKLLDLWSAGWKHRGRTRAVGPGAYERYATLGLFGHGGVVGVSNATGLREACIAVNRFLRTRFPDGTWSSIAVLFNPRMGLHRDIQNMPGHSNHALALGEYTGGRVWIEDDEGDSPAWLEDKKGGRELRGRWLDMHDKPVSFDARRYHKVEPHEGSMWDSDLAPRGLPGPSLVSEGAPGNGLRSVPRILPSVPSRGLPGLSLVSEGAPGSRL